MLCVKASIFIKEVSVRRSAIFSIYDFVKSLNDEHSLKKYMSISKLRLTKVSTIRYCQY